MGKISIVTTSYTLERLNDIQELLDSIHNQTYSNIETLIVIERSKELFERLKLFIKESRYHNMQLLFNRGPHGISPARNLGIAHSTGDIIAFVDDDAVLSRSWAENTNISYDESNSIVGVTGPIKPLWANESMKWFPREFYWIFSCTGWDMKEKTIVRNGYGTNLSFRAEVFQYIEPFRSDLGVLRRGSKAWTQPAAEETEFSLRVTQTTNKNIIYDPAVIVHHKVYEYRMQQAFIARRAYWEGYGKALIKYLFRHRMRVDRILSTEYELLVRILFILLPKSILRMFYQPIISLRHIWLITIILVCVTIGYVDCSFRILFRNHPS